MNCLLCGSEQKDIFARVESFGYPLVYYQCGNCGLVFQSTEESRAADPDFYAETYRRIYQASEDPTPKDLWVQEQRAAYLVGLLRAQQVKSPERILDIGASTGTLLGTIRDAFGSDVTGVEPGDAYRAFAEKRGLKMSPSLEALVATQPERFDLISLIHVLEHLPDPVGTLRRVREDLLSEKGVLLLEVPNFYAHDSYELAHLACYTPHTLREALKQAGYSVKYMQSHGMPRSSLLNLYLTVLAQPQPEGVGVPFLKADKFVRINRQTGFLYRRIVQRLIPQKAWLPLPDNDES